MDNDPDLYQHTVDDVSDLTDEQVIARLKLTCPNTFSEFMEDMRDVLVEALFDEQKWGEK